jgi:uncharacterized protein
MSDSKPASFKEVVVWVFWNGEERRIRAFWRLVAHLAIFSLLLMATFLLVLTVVFMATPSFILASSLASLLAIVGSMLLAAHFLDRRPFADFGFHFNKAWWLDLGFGMALGALLMGAIFVIELLAGWITITDTFYRNDPDIPFIVAFLLPLAIFLCVGIWEEMLTRGYWLRTMAEGLQLGAIGPAGALVLGWVISSALFGLGHALNPNATLISTIYLILAGIFLGLGYVLTGELAIPIGIHITWNLFQGNVFGFPVSGSSVSSTTVFVIEQGGPPLWTGGRFGPEAGLLGLVALVVGSALIVLWVRARSGRVALATRLIDRMGMERDEP